MIAEGSFRLDFFFGIVKMIIVDEGGSAILSARVVRNHMRVMAVYV
jgi:hypothetical protein